MFFHFTQIQSHLCLRQQSITNIVSCKREFPTNITNNNNNNQNKLYNFFLFKAIAQEL
jgi:hypothetical protein